MTLALSFALVLGVIHGRTNYRNDEASNFDIHRDAPLDRPYQQKPEDETIHNLFSPLYTT